MLDAIVYSFDHRGRLTLEELTFASLHELARYLASPANQERWEWAEVEMELADGNREIVRYTAAALRGTIIASFLNPNAN